MTTRSELRLQRALVEDYRSSPTRFNKALGLLANGDPHALRRGVELVSPKAAYSPDLILLDKQRRLIGVLEVKLNAQDNLLLWETVRVSSNPAPDTVLRELRHHFESEFDLNLHKHAWSGSCCWLHKYERGEASRGLIGRPGVSQFDAYLTNSWAHEDVLIDSRLPIVHLFLSPNGRKVSAKWALKPKAWVTASWSQLSEALETHPSRPGRDRWLSLARLEISTEESGAEHENCAERAVQQAGEEDD